VNLRGRRANVGQLPLEIYMAVSDGSLHAYGAHLPFCSCSRHSKVISNSYGSSKRAGLFLTSTPRSETTDILKAAVIDREQKQVRRLI
jgi:hypothetical protein